MTELLDRYREWLIASGASPDTVRGRVGGARRLLAIAGTTNPVEIAPSHVVSLLAGATARWTKATYYQHAHNFAAWCAFVGMQVSFVEGVPRPKPPRPHPHPVGEAEFEKAFASAGEREAMMLALGRYQGLRVHEIAKVRGEHVTPVSIYVDGKGGREAHLPLHPTVERLRERFPADDWWFPSPVGSGPISRSTVYRSIHRAFKRVGVNATPHELRHLFGTSLVTSGSDLRVAQKLLRHASLSTTEIYTDVGDDRLRAAILRLPDTGVA